MSSDSNAMAVIPAATVLLLREDDAGRLQVLMTKRAPGMSFMAGLWVFPGGRMEASDLTSAVAERVVPTEVEHVRHRMLDREGAPLPYDTALGLHVAGCRETFEEAGVLLAGPRGASGGCDAGQLARVAQSRAGASSAAGFVELLEREDLVLEIDRLVYWSHWITPSRETKRFDTRFFAIRVPPGQEASVDLSETTHHAWLHRDEILAALQGGEMRMAPPTLVTLEDLWASHDRHGDVDAMLAAEQTASVPPRRRSGRRTGTRRRTRAWRRQNPCPRGTAHGGWRGR